MREVFWIGSSLDALREFPTDVMGEAGFALYQAQSGGRHAAAKPLKGFGGAGVLEVVGNHDGSTYRTVYTVRFAKAIYVLDAFQKKSKTKTKTPKQIIERIKKRLKDAEADYKERFREHEDQGDQEGG